jgi:DNA invertase Pin-like site-specific DNA recombinase
MKRVTQMVVRLRFIWEVGQRIPELGSENGVWGLLATHASVYRAKGRKPSMDVERVRELRDSGMGGSAIAKELGIGRASVYRALGS